MGKSKILILGIGQSNFLNQLYGEILKENDSYDFNIDTLTHLPNDKHNRSNEVFQEVLDFNQYLPQISKWQKINIFVNAIKKTFYKEAFLFELNQKKSIKSAIKNCKRLALKEYVYLNHIEPKNFDVLHFHFCVSSNLEYLHFIKKSTKVICSFWGSDLFRVSDIYNNYYVSKALNNANLITVQSPEMGLLVKAKYGMNLNDKIRDIRFTLSKDIYEFIDLYRNNTKVLDEFKAKYNLKKENFLIALGHNAFKENNHIKMIESLNGLSEEYKNKITLILHLSYGGNKEYIDNLKKVIQQIKDLDIKIIEDFLGPQEISKLRLITDIMVQAPISDALSGAMTEVLYANNKVIVGGWLPYGILRRNHIQFEEFDYFRELPLKLIESLKVENFKVTTGNKNQINIEKFLFPVKTSNDWIKLFNTLINE